MSIPTIHPSIHWLTPLFLAMLAAGLGLSLTPAVASPEPAARVLPLSSVWSAPLQVIDASPNIVGDPALTVQGRAVYAAWRYYDYTQGAIDRRLAASADGGFSWTPVASLPDIGFSFNLAADPQTPGRLYAAYLAGGDPPGYSYEIRLLRSDDGGQSWPVEQLAAASPLIGNVKLAMEQNGRLHLTWQRRREVYASSSQDGGLSWSEPMAIGSIGSMECPGEYNLTAGDGAVYVAMAGGCHSPRLYRSVDGGQSWTESLGPEELTGLTMAAVGAAELYLAWTDYEEGLLNLAASADGGVSWTVGSQLSLPAEPTALAMTARGSGQVVLAWRSADGWLYLAESVDGGRQLSQPAGVEELGYPLGELVLAADPLSGLAVALWNRNSTELRAVSTAPPPQPGDCPAVELLSARRLDEQTLGVVGWVDLNAGLQAASLTAAGVVAPVDLLALARHNAPSGGSNPGGEQRWPGLWSATLRSGASLAGPVTLAAATVDAAGVPCAPPKQLELPAASPWRLELQTIVPAGDDPAAAGLARIAGTLSSLWGNAPALPEPLTFTLSRYVAGSPGQWVEVAAVSSPGPAWSFTDIPAGVVQPGENLYRVAATGPDGALLAEDVEGFYAVAATTELALNEADDHHRRQALVFRDAVREVVGSNGLYAKIFPEQLILAIGSAENGMFDNAIADGIMQVTCASGHQGETERNGIVCILPPKHRPNDPPTNPYIYMDTAESIKFNVSDALLVLLEAYNTANQQNTQFHKPNCRPISDINDPHRVDKLISSVLYYNGGVCYGKIYKRGGGNPQYLYDVVRQLDPQPDYPNSLPNNQNIAQFLADADHIAGVSLTPDLVTRLNYGQDIVNQVLEYE